MLITIQSLLMKQLEVSAYAVDQYGNLVTSEVISFTSVTEP